MFPSSKVEEVSVGILVVAKGLLFSGESLSIARRILFIQHFLFENAHVF